MSMIQVNTSRFGTIEVNEATIIHFVSPILGFELLKRFVMVDHGENSPFKWLQSADEPELAFVITNPKFFAIPYEFALPDDAVEKMDVQSAEDVLVFTIVNIPGDNPARMTANLLAPIVVNQNTLKAMQVILQDPKLSTRTRLLPDSAEQGQSEQVKTSSSEPGKV